MPRNKMNQDLSMSCGNGCSTLDPGDGAATGGRGEVYRVYGTRQRNDGSLRPSARKISANFHSLDAAAGATEDGLRHGKHC